MSKHPRKTDASIPWDECTSKSPAYYDYCEAKKAARNYEQLKCASRTAMRELFAELGLLKKEAEPEFEFSSDSD